MTSGAEASADLPARPESIRQARRLVSAALADVAPPVVVDDLMLATSELVTNAIEHGDPAVSDSVRVEVWVDGSAAFITVRSAGGARLRDSVHWEMPAVEAVSGRGLGIVRRLADAVDVVRSGDLVAITLQRGW